ncbi:NUDIX domain-containing protein [Streptomyces sp. B6B3]|uniref:NUDIX domain-containing protein n=1 Tax=Streptomyces sp. B6B3 TaxID=3153570 RepID=UPI00325C8506
MSPRRPRPVRRSARVLLLDAADRLLLFRMKDATPGAFCWITPGGGVRRAERVRAAAARELWEETGLRVAPRDLGARVAWTGGRAEFSWASGYFEDVFFLHRVRAHEVDTSHMEELERGQTTAHHWWSLDELAATGERIHPFGLPGLLGELLAGRIPAEPVRLPWHHAQDPG